MSQHQLTNTSVVQQVGFEFYILFQVVCHRKHSFCKASNYQDSGLLGCDTVFW